MAITFEKDKKKRRNLLLIVALAILASLAIIWWGFFSTPSEVPATTQPSSTFNQVQIKFNVLDSEELERLMPFEQIPAFTATSSGRNNPFVPY